MNYKPKTEEQLAKEGLLPEGTYDFEIIETSDKPSAKGNDMIMLKMVVFADDGSTRIVWDYIVFGNNFGERKFRHAAAACGLIEIYDSGELRAHTFMGGTGKALLKQQEAKGEFLPRNVVADYLPRDNEDKPTDTRPTREIVDDGIPF